MSTILYTHPSAELYGSDKTLLQAVQASIRTGDRVVVALPERGVLAEHLERAGATVEIGELGAAMRADLAPARFASFLVKARTGARFVGGLVERYGVDLVHTNTSVLVGAAYGAYRSSAAHVWHVHEILDSPQWANLTMRRVIKRWADLAIANSESTARTMFDPKMRWAEVVHNGVDPDEARTVEAPSRAQIEERFGVPQSGSLVVIPGRINGWKGQQLVIDAIDLARIELADVQFVVAGDAPSGQEHFADALDARVAQSGLDQTVHRIGFTTDLSALFAAADVSLVPSTRPEPFGMVAIESMAVGTPVLGAAHGGLTEIIHDGINGALFIPGSPEDLAEQLVKLVHDDVLRARLGAAAKDAVASNFDVAHYGDRLTALHHQVIEGLRGPVRAAA